MAAGAIGAASQYSQFGAAFQWSAPAVFMV
jgi:hypothetical protein